MRTRALLPLAALSLFLPPLAAESPEPAPIERARFAAAELTTELGARLKRELEAGGPVAAARVCSGVAQLMAAAHSRDGVTVRRVSERFRNPADLPDAWESARLAELRAALERGELPDELAETVIEEGTPVLRYLKPIRVGELCLSCHGDPESFPEELRRFLAERYGADRAVGYRVGDLRGAVSVTVRPTPAGSSAP